MKPRFPLYVLAFLIPLTAKGQQFSVVQSRAAAWHCHGWVRIEGSSLYCSDARTHELSKFLPDGQQVFQRLQAPSVGRSSPVLALAEDANHTIYVIDGMNIHLYSPDGQYQRSITPGIALSTGIAVLDPQHIFVSGRTPRGDSKSTIFLIGPNGVEQSFSDVFVHGLQGTEDLVMNSASFLALDRVRGLVYQVSQQVYELRVFDFEGKLVRTILPPAEYRTRTPAVTHFGNGINLEPGDGLSDIAVLPDGGIAVQGDILDHAETEGKKTTVSYSRFVDVYDSKGIFRRRFTGGDLRLNGAYFSAFDHATGRAYFKNEGSVLEAQLR